jgi:crossover junction endodeoxyribonuclease RuvC
LQILKRFFPARDGKNKKNFIPPKNFLRREQMPEKKTEEVFILGIDPGSIITGYSILKKESSGKIFLSDFGYLKMKPSDSLKSRVGRFGEFAEEKIEKFNINKIAIETSFFSKNPQVFLKLGYLRGAIYFIAHKKKLEVLEFSPKEVKKAIVGTGSATKEQVLLMITHMFPAISKDPRIKTMDTSDAIGIGICGMWKTIKQQRQNHIIEKEDCQKKYEI